MVNDLVDFGSEPLGASAAIAGPIGLAEDEASVSSPGSIPETDSLLLPASKRLKTSIKNSQGLLAPARLWLSQSKGNFSGLLASLILHGVVLMILSLLFPRALEKREPASLLLGMSTPQEKFDKEQPSEFTSPLELPEVPVRITTPDIDQLNEITPWDQEPSQATKPSQVPAEMGNLSTQNWFEKVHAPVRVGLKGRGKKMRASLLKEEGGNSLSEGARNRALDWLRAHQHNDGSWSFDHQLGPCGSRCRNTGSEASTTAATAIALLPFYGAGQTHKEGNYQNVVNRGLYYLGLRMLMTPQGGDLQEGSMYGQGLSAIVLCEAYAMSGDENLKEFAQAALDFIVHAQHSAGGWRYVPGTPGDTTVVGWQFMAIKSGQMAGLKIPPAVVYKVMGFLDALQADEGAQYGYRVEKPTPRATCTAVGLLCRIYGGWPREMPALRRGVEYLGKLGPSKDNMYYNYYATQVMHQYGGEHWKRWNSRMRDHLIATQANTGHEAGSWYFGGRHAKTGGRLYHTAMAAMTLEVYYRYMPIYRLGQDNE